jgi:Swi5-dependent recombination DNA repair protein 1
VLFTRQIKFLIRAYPILFACQGQLEAMDATPVVKRRKLNPVNKPFKSPLKTSLGQNMSPHISSPLATAPVKNVSDDVAHPPTVGVRRNPLQATPLKRLASSNTSASPALSSDPATHQEIQSTIRAIRSHESSLAKTRQDIDMLNQALRLATSDKDSELDTLAIKWRMAARQAAEEVFAGARDKVNRMGGVGAWRERQAEQAKFNEWKEPEPKEVYDENGELVEVEKEERYDDEWEYDAERRKEEKRDEGMDDDVCPPYCILKPVC